jgi:hypothetical protein
MSQPAARGASLAVDPDSIRIPATIYLDPADIRRLWPAGELCEWRDEPLSRYYCIEFGQGVGDIGIIDRADLAPYLFPSG